MADDPNYIEFRDRLLVAIANDQGPIGSREVNILAMIKKHRLPNNKYWQHMVSRDLVRLGYGDIIGNEIYLFRINGSGLEAASKIELEQRPRGLWRRFDQMNWTKWGVIVALALGIATLIVELAKN